MTDIEMGVLVIICAILAVLRIIILFLLAILAIKLLWEAITEEWEGK